MKSAVASKTVWVNVLTAVAGVAGYLAGAEALQDYTAILPIFIAVMLERSYRLK